jgi:hypothetical protein
MAKKIIVIEENKNFDKKVLAALTDMRYNQQGIFNSKSKKTKWENLTTEVRAIVQREQLNINHHSLRKLLTYLKEPHSGVILAQLATHDCCTESQFIGPAFEHLFNVSL